MFRILRQIINENYKYRSQIRFLARVDKEKAFKGSDLGWVWALFKPSIRIAVYYVAMIIGFKASKDFPGIHCSYFLWLVTGLVPWFYMSSMIGGGAKCFRKYKGIIKNTDFPQTAIPSIVMLSNLKVHLVIFGLTLVMYVAMGYGPSIYWIQLPIYIILLLVFTYFWSLATGVLSAISVEFLNILNTISSAVLWLSAIFFERDAVNNPIVDVFFKLNPVTFIVYGYRNSLCYHRWIFEDLESLIWFLAVLIVMVFISTKLFSGLRKQMPDIL